MFSDDYGDPLDFLTGVIMRLTFQFCIQNISTIDWISLNVAHIFMITKG